MHAEKSTPHAHPDRSARQHRTGAPVSGAAANPLPAAAAAGGDARFLRTVLCFIIYGRMEKSDIAVDCGFGWGGPVHVRACV